MSFPWQMDKQGVAWKYNGILFDHKKNEILIHATTRMNFENIMTSEKSQSQKTTYDKIP